MPPTETTPLPIRKHPLLQNLFQQAESRFLTDDELQTIRAVLPRLEPQTRAAREVRSISPQILETVTQEVCLQYGMADYDTLGTDKTHRDLSYVLAYAVQSLVMDDPQWFDDKLLVWLKSIFKSYDFPARIPGADNALFADPSLESRLRELPVKARAIYHAYYRLHFETCRRLPPDLANLVAPYTSQPLRTLFEDYSLSR